MDETRGASTLNLPAEAVREVIVSRATPELFQSLNATGAVRVTTRSGGDEWHGNLFGNLRDRFAGLAGFPSGSPKYSRQQYGFGAGGALIKDKAFLFIGGERTKQDGVLPIQLGFPCSGVYVAGLCGTSAPNQISLQSAYFRENMLTARLDYNLSENMKLFARFSYDNANEIGPSDSQSNFRNQLNVPAAAVGSRLEPRTIRAQRPLRLSEDGERDQSGLEGFGGGAVPHADWLVSTGAKRGRSAPDHSARSLRALRQQHDLQSESHDTLRGQRFIASRRGDFYAPGNFGPSVTSSNGLAVIAAINSNPNLVPIIPGDPRGAADNPLNYPVGTVHDFQWPRKFQRELGIQPVDGRSLRYARPRGTWATRSICFQISTLVFGVNYVRDSGRTNSDLAAVCHARPSTQPS